MSELPLRPNVCMLIFNKAGKLFLGERHGSPGVWQFPQGGVDKGSSLEDNVIRELKEEIGVKRKHLQIRHKCSATHDYEFANPPRYARGKWRGQSQTFWLVEFLGEDKDIDLCSHEQELMAWRWCNPKEILKLAEPKRIAGYRKPLMEFESWWKSNHTA